MPSTIGLAPSLPRLLLVAFVAAFFATSVLQWWGSDDGMMLTVVRHYRSTGAFTWLLHFDDAPIGFMRPWLWLQAMLDPGGERWYQVAMRAPSMLSAVAMLLCVDLVARRLPEATTAARLTAIALVGGWVLHGNGGLVSSRPDTFYGLTAALALWAGVEVLQNRRAWPLCCSLPAAGIAFACHPNGIYAFLLHALLLWLLLRQPDRPAGAVAVLLGSGLAGAALWYLLAVAPLGPTGFLESVRRMASDEDGLHAIPFYMEFLRYRGLLFGNALIGLPILAAAGLAVLGAGRARTTPAGRLCLYGLLLGMLYLTFQPAKWEAYLTILVPPLAATAGFGLTRLAQARAEVAAAAIAAVMAVSGVHWLSTYLRSDNYVLWTSLGFGTARTAELTAFADALAGRSVLTNPVMYPLLARSRLLPDGTRERPDAVISPAFEAQGKLEADLGLRLKLVRSIRFQTDYYNQYAPQP